MTIAPMPAIVAAVLALAALFAMLRLLRQRQHPPRTRLVTLLLAQPLLAALLYFTLFPPLRPVAGDLLVVLTADASSVAAPQDVPRIALPEAPATADAEPMPDLATALRLHPEARRLHVVGAGLEARDIETARRLPITFAASAAPVGLADLHAPSQVAAGNAFAVHGRIAGLPGATVELRDPAGQRAQLVTTDAQGRFVVQGKARSEGLATFSLIVSDKAGKTRDTLPLPLRIDAPPQPRVLALAGAPTPELKYLRRWAVDVGIHLHTRIGTGGGLTLGDAPLALDAASLRRFDAVLLDVRSLRALGGSELAALTAAVRDGLGLLLRIDEPLSPADRTRLRSWGYALDAGQSTEPAQLPGDAALPALTRRILRIDAADAATLLRDARDRPLASWRTLGRGRVAVLAFDDSFQLALGGYPSRHAGLWSDLVAAVARARDAAPLSPPTSLLWPGERTSLCGLDRGAVVLAPGGETVPLIVDPATGTRRCAAFWPRNSGWHVLRQGDAQLPFAVLPADAGAALRAQHRRDATLALAAQRVAAPAREIASRRGPAWPWLGAWLALATLTWWLERRRAPASAATSPVTSATTA